MPDCIEPPLPVSFETPKRVRRPLRPPTLASARQRLSPEMARNVFQGVDVLMLIGLVMESHGRTGWEEAFALAAPFVIVFALRVAGALRFPRGERILPSLAWAGVVTAAAYAGFFAAGRAMVGPSAPAFDGRSAGLAVAEIMTLHLAWFCLMTRWREKGLLTPNIAVIGATPIAHDLILDLLNGHGAGEANVIGIFDDRHKRAPKEILGVPVLGPVDDLINHRTLASIDRIVITMPHGAAARAAQLFERLSALPHEIVLVVEESDDRASGRLGGLHLARMGGRHTVARRAAAKRAQDIIFGSLGLLAALPIGLIVALAVKLDSPGPVFFRQKRHGFNNEEIWVLKFRSMRHDRADATAARQVTKDDDRVTRVGRVIRKLRLDELPQLINVLRGEMSLVGPRPHAVGMKSGGADAASLVNSYSHRHRMKPGLTGLAAIHGSRGPVDDAESLRRRVMLDLSYIDRQSVWLDLWIMLMTLPLMLGDKSAAR
ncbi:MAG: exopolysaccharide biosynthesis polyprenyl glycosylphosphotransferase [Caulobacteraceae bacterium]